MRLTLIKPNMGRMMSGSYVDEGRMEPLQIGILAALTPEDVDIVFYDDRCEEINYDASTDLVAITVETFTAKRSYEISSEFRRRGVKVVMGGMHPTLLPSEVELHADSVVIGDAETIWKELIEDAKNNRLKARYIGRTTVVQEGVFPRRDIFKNKGYLKLSLMQFSRGCGGSCKFCASSVFFSGKHHCRAIEDVVDEIKSQNLKRVFFVDDNIVYNHEKAKELFKALIPLKIKWVSQAFLSMLEDRELMELMMKSGCLGNVIGFESIVQNSLVEMDKKGNTRDPFYKKSIEILRDFGHQTWAAFTIGHDNDTVKSIEETLDFAIANKFAFAAFNVIMPYPSTGLYDRLKSENRLLYDGKWWIHDDFRFNHAPYIPKNMTPDELTELGFMCRKEFNKPKSIFLRALDLKTNMRNIYKLGVYMAYNPLFRKEVYKKQGMILGGK